MKRDDAPVHLDKMMRDEAVDKRIEVIEKEVLQIGITDVARRDQKQLVGHPVQDKRIDKVSVLGDDNTFFTN